MRGIYIHKKQTENGSGITWKVSIECVVELKRVYMKILTVRLPLMEI